MCRSEFFQECDTCAAKPGTPVLCAGCLNNRIIISRLEACCTQLQDQQNVTLRINWGWLLMYLTLIAGVVAVLTWR